MASVLVTGASGFTGTALCRRLTAEGQQVVAFVRQTSNTQVLQEMGVECRVVDIKDRHDVQRHFDGIEHVFHIAAAYRAEHADVDEFRLVNVEATRNLLEAAKTTGVKRFVHCSTVGVQGEIEKPPASETYRTKPNDHYQESKLDGEKLALQYFRNGLPGAVVRPVGIYGPGDTRFLKLFKAINKKRFVMIGSGNTLYHMTYIDDLIDGFLLVGTREDAMAQVFTIAGERYTTIRELANLVADVLNKPHPRLQVPFWPVYWASVVCDKVCRFVGVNPPLYPRRVEFFQLDRAFSIEKAKQVLGYRPNVSLVEGLRRTAKWYQEQGLV